MNITVTGAAGSLGRRVWETLLAAGHDVRATDKAPRPGLPGPLAVANLVDHAACQPLVHDAEVVVHLASHVGDHEVDGARFFSENVTMNMNVFQAATTAGVKLVLFASSVQVTAGASESGPPAPYLPLDGELPPRPGNRYALSKHFGELSLRYFTEQAGLNGVAIRFPWLLDNGTLAKCPFPPEPTGRGLQEGLAILHFRDAASLIADCVRVALPGFRIYFPAAPDNLLGLPAATVIRRYYPGVPLRRPLDQIPSLVDLSRIQSETGWSSRFSRWPA